MPFLAQGAPLSDAEAVLLVDDRHCQVVELKFLLDEGMGTYHDLGATGGDLPISLFSLLGFQAPGEEPKVHFSSLVKVVESGVMLLGQYLGGSHDDPLSTVGHGHEHSRRGHHRLAGTHIPLQ